MPKQFFALKLVPNRPDFAQTMTAEERGVMMQHIAYWKPMLDTGVMVVFGPVMDPAGAYGLGIIQVDDEAEVGRLIAADPAGKINRYEYHPMMAVVSDRFAQTAS